MKIPFKNTLITALPLLALGIYNTAHADSFKKLIPAVKSSFYYKLGGGQDIPLPAFYDTSYIPLNVDGSAGLGFDCGVFNPGASLTNSLNQIKSSFIAVKSQVLKDATGAVTELPLYELSREDPNLYNIITDAIAGARQSIAVSTKSCEVMQSEIGAGQNPYAHWGQISLGNQWKQEIGTAELSGNGDINQARYNVSHSAGKNGVPWVDPDATGNVNATRNAGGQGQPAIHVINDTAAAGYHVILNDSAGNLGSSQSALSQIWPNAKAAAEWITNVVGDETITTYNAGQKSSKPGVGLYTDIQHQTQQLIPQLQHIIVDIPMADKAAMKKALLAISSAGMAVSPQIINSLKMQPRINQAILIDKLAQNIAAMRVINKARLAMRILQSGGRIPAIYANKAAQQNIKTSIKQLQQDIQNILMFVKARQSLMSNMLSTVMQAGAVQQAQNTAIAVPNNNVPQIQNGAIQTTASK